MFSPFKSRSRTSMPESDRTPCLLPWKPWKNRVLLTAVPPTVTAVNLGSTQWTSAFVNFIQSQGLGAGGYAVPAGSNQLKTLPWTNLNQVRITFDQDVHVTAGDLSVSGTNVTAYAFSDFSYDSNTYTATWTLATTLAKDKILFDLDADGMNPVHNSEGQALDGAWTNGTQQSFPPATAMPATISSFASMYCPGTSMEIIIVNIMDATVVRAKIGKACGDTGYNIRYDITATAQSRWTITT